MDATSFDPGTRRADDGSAKRRPITVTTSRLGRAFLALLLAAQAAGLLAPMAMHPAEAAFPGANGKIVFRTTGGEIVAMNPDGTGREELNLGTAGPHYGPAWSADGHWMAYSSGFSSESEIYMWTDGYVDSHGTQVPGGTRRLTTSSGIDGGPSFSPDGSKIAFASDRDGNDEIYVMDTVDADNDGNGDNPTRLTNDAADDFDPVWSSDGTRIAFVRVQDQGTDLAIYVMNANGTNPVRLAGPAGNDLDPNWSPDGTRIAFTNTNWESGKTSQIWIMNADGSGSKRLTTPPRWADDWNPAWSPDGKKIVFASLRSSRNRAYTDLYVMKAKPEGRKNRPKNLSKSDGEGEHEPDWRPIP